MGFGEDDGFHEDWAGYSANSTYFAWQAVV